MGKHNKHTVLAAIVMLMIGGVAFQMMRADAVAVANSQPAVSNTLSPLDLMKDAHGLTVQTVADPI